MTTNSNIYLPKKTVFCLKQDVLNVMNSIYSSDIQLSEISFYGDGAISNPVFHLNAVGPTYEQFHIGHLQYSNDIQKRLSFKKFDVNLDQYFENILKFYSIRFSNAHIQFNTRFCFNKIYKNPLANKLIKPTLNPNGIKIEGTFKADNRFFGKVYIQIDLVNGNFIVSNKELIEMYLKELSDGTCDGTLDFDYTLTSNAFVQLLNSINNVI